MWLSHEIWSCPIFRHIYVQEPSENVASYPNKQREEFYGCKETRNRTALPSFSQLRIGSTKKTVKFCWPWSDEQYLPVKEHSPLWRFTLFFSGKSTTKIMFQSYVSLPESSQKIAQKHAALRCSQLWRIHHRLGGKHVPIN